MTIFVAYAVAPADDASAQPASDWPCVQRKVPEIALGAVWNSEAPGAAARAWESDPEIAGLVSRLAARRTELAEAHQMIQDYVKRLGADRPARLTLVFQGLFETLNAERSSVIDGIERYGRKQVQLAGKLRNDQDALAAKRAQAGADASEIADMQDQLLWETRIFDERRKSLSFVCEVPVLIEQRLFDLSRTIQSAMK